ncbi:MAG: hypothetical protein ACP5G7_09910, partial [Anaerolineae bacterium]
MAEPSRRVAPTSPLLRHLWRVCREGGDGGGGWRSLQPPLQTSPPQYLWGRGFRRLGSLPSPTLIVGEGSGVRVGRARGLARQSREAVTEALATSLPG